MPPNKRQRREQEEIAALASSKGSALESPATQQPPSIERDESDEEGTEPVVKGPAAMLSSGFALLGDASAEGQSEEDEPAEKAASSSKTKTKKKKKKAPLKTPETSMTPTQSKPNEQPKPRVTSSGKKGKGKGKQEDDLDRALAELSLKYSDITIPDPTHAQASAPALASALQTFRSLLALQPKFLDSDAEMRRFFGSKVISAAESSSASGSGSQNPQPRGPVARSVLCRPKPSWPPAAARDGLGMRPLTGEEIRTNKDDSDSETGWTMGMPGDKWFTVEHSPEYRWDQAQFIQAVAMLDPNNLFALMRESWWQVDVLLQIGEIYRAQDDYAVSSDFTSRALFAYERSFSGAFNLSNGASRIDFRKIENRSLFLALNRTVIYLERRGTMRTAFEFARLLWALDPWNDPHGAMMHLDFLVVKAEQYEWFLEVEQTWNEIREEKQDLPPLSSRPGWRWSKALVLRGISPKKGGGEKKATEELKQAFLEFPEVLAVLMPLVGSTIPQNAKLPSVPNRWDPSDNADSTLWLSSMVYAHRSLSLWKIPETLSWLNSTVQSVGLITRPRQRKEYQLLHSKPKASNAFVKSVIRHALVSDLKPLAPYMGSLHAIYGPQDGYDIMPPDGQGVTRYDEAYFATANAETAKKRREGAAGGGRRGRAAQNQRVEVDPAEFLEMLEGVLTFQLEEGRRDQMLRALQEGPGLHVIRQVERWVRQHPDFAEQYPNARRYLLQPAAERPRPGPIQDAGPAPGINDLGPFVGPMPGAFAGDVVEQHAEDGDSIDEEEYQSDEDAESAPILPIRIARGLMNMIWGGGGTADANHDPESEEDAAEDETGRRD